MPKNDARHDNGRCVSRHCSLGFKIILDLPIKRKTFAIHGTGLGLRRELLPSLESGVPEVISFFEVSPENWIDIGGRLGKQFRIYTERHRFIAHGLSLSIGGVAPLDIAFFNFIEKRKSNV